VGRGDAWRVFLEQVHQGCECGFWRRFWATRTRWTWFAGFLRELQVGRERNPEHVDHEAQDAAEAGILAQERDELGDVELVHQLGARTGDLVARE
jgi:hypothetical protein